MTERNGWSVRRSLRSALALIFAVGWIVRAGGMPGDGQARAADPTKPAPVPVAAAPAQAAPAQVAPPQVAPPQAIPAQAVPIQIAPAQIKAIPLRGGLAQFKRAGRQPSGDGSDDTLEGVFGPPDRETLKHLERAKQLAQDGRYSESLQLLDDILESSQDYFFRPEDGISSQRGLKAEARRLISSQPLEGLKAYELLFGAKAQRMLDDALKIGDINAVAEVARRYFNTQAGYQATLLLGRYDLDHNQPLAGALCFQRLQETQGAAERFEPSLSILLAVAWARGGMNARAEEVLLQLKKQDPRTTIHFGGQPVALFGDSVQALPWLMANVGHQQASSDEAATNWALFRGNPARNASSAGGTPLLNPRWRVPTTEQQTAERAVLTARQENLDRNIPILPVMQPLAVGDVVLMRTARSLLAVDFNTGKRIWEVRSQSDLQSDRVAAAGARIAAMQGGDPSLSEKLWENATTGTLASDGLFIFAVEDLSNTAALPNEPARIVMRPNGAVRVTGERPTNELAAYELRTQGKLQWKVGGDKRDSDIVEPKLSGAYFLGPPLPLMGSLYVMAEIKGEIRLVVLDGKTGKLQWQQQLAYVEQNAMQDTYRRLAGASPSYADGVLICPTAAGAVVAVDLANRSLLWGFEYPHNQQMPQQQMMAIRMGMAVANYGMQNYLGDRWADATATIADGNVVLTPIESDQLFCLNLIDGKLLWKQDRGENVYVGCVQDGNALLVGRKQVQALKLADGKLAWSHPLELPAGGMPSGRGFLSEGAYYLPLSSAEVLKIDLASGAIAGRAKSSKGYIPGNLICYKGDVVSQGVDSLDTFFQLEPLRQKITAQLAENPENPWALARRGEIALDEGRLNDAIADTRHSFDKDPNPSTRELLVESMLAALGKDFKTSHALIGELEKLLALDSERAEFLRLMAVGLQKQDDRIAALEAYMQLVDLQWHQGEPENVETNLAVRRDRWVKARFDELYAAATSEERGKIDAAVAARLKTAVDTKTAKPLRQFLSYFGNHPAADEARERLVQLVQISNLPDTLLEREGLLHQLGASKDPARQRAAVAQMAALLVSAARPEEAVPYYHRLATEWADIECFGGKTGKQMIAALPVDSPEARALAETNIWPVGQVNRENSGPRNLRGMNFQRPFVLEWHGDHDVLPTTTVLFDQQQQQVVGRDGAGREQFRIPLAESGQQNRMGFVQPSAPNLSFASAHEHLLLVNLGNQILAMDTLRPAGSGSRVLWQQELQDLPPNMFNVTPVQARAINVPFAAPRFLPAVGPGGPVIGVAGPFTSHGLCIARSRDLTMYDPSTGSVAWVRHGLSPNCEVFGDDDVLIIAPPDGSAAQLVRTSDGHLMGTRTLPAADARWSYCGRRVLHWMQTPQAKIKLVLSDPWKHGEQVLGEFPAGSKGTLFGPDGAAMLEPGGHFVTLSLRDGSKLIDQQLEPEPMLHDIVVQATPGQVMLIADRPSRHPNAASRVVAPVLMADPTSPLVSGHVYAFDPATGKPQWPAPAIVETHYALLSYGQDLPVILFLRPMQVRSAQGNGEIKSSVLFLDRRNGRAVHQEELAQPLNNMNFELIGDHRAKTISLMLPNQTLTLHYTDDPLAPEPPYQAGLALRQSKLGTTAAGAVLRALGGAARDLDDDGDSFDDDATQ